MNTDLNMNNRLLCTFTTLGDLDNLIGGLSNKYSILYNKMFVLHIKSNNEYVVTYEDCRLPFDGSTAKIICRWSE